MKQEVSTKVKILNTATALFAQKGFLNTTISHIAREVGIGESTIYEHFKNKEDILFSIPGEKVQQLIEINEKHLGGLVGAHVKLRKLIWNYTEFLTENPSFLNILLFNLRPNRLFYRTEGYEKIRTFTREFRKAIEEGIENGEFRKTLNSQHVLWLIFGAIDHILITWTLEEKPADPVQALEPFFDLLDRALLTEPPGSDEDDKRKNILHAAEAIFSESGYNRARIQEIARRAGVGDGTIYQYFKNKEDILFTLPIEHSRELISIHKARFHDSKDTEFRLMTMVSDYIHFLEIHREYCNIVLLELRYNRRFYSSPAYELFHEFAHIFYNIIKDGMKRGHFRESINPIMVVKMIFGTIDHGLLSWLMFNKPERPVALSEPLSRIFINALKP